MLYVKQSTTPTIRIGPFLDDTDGKTPENGLSIVQASVRLSKAGGAFAQKNDATTCTNDENGWYSCPLNATDTGTLGSLQLAVNFSGALPVWHEFTVLAANVYDALVGGGDLLQVDMTQIDGDATNGNNATLNLKKLNVVNSAGDAIVATSSGANGQGFIATGNGTGAGFKGQGGATNGNGIEGAKGGLSGSDIKGNLVGTVSNCSNVTNPVTVTSVSGAVGSVTGNVGGNVTGSVGSLAAQAKLDVNAECDTANADYGANTTVPDAAGTAATLIGALNNIAAADVWAVLTSVVAQAKPAADGVIDFGTAISTWWASWRNKINVTSSEVAVRNDDDDATLFDAAVSDNGTTFVKDEYETGA